MVESHCENMWSNNSVAGLGRHPTADYGAAADFPSKQLIISQQRLRSEMLILWIKNLLTTGEKFSLGAFKTSYT